MFDVHLQGDRETVFLTYPRHERVSDLFWPGDHRAGELFTDRAFLEAMVARRGRLGGRRADGARRRRSTPRRAATR